MQPPLAARSCATFESAAHRENEKTEEQLYLLVHLGHDAPLLVVNHVDDHGQAIQAILPQRLPPPTTSRPPLYPPIIKLSARSKTRTRPRSYAPHHISVSDPFVFPDRVRNNHLVGEWVCGANLEHEFHVNIRVQLRYS